MLISSFDQKLWVIQFYQDLYGNYWEFEMFNWDIVNISRMIDGRNIKFSKAFQIEIYFKLQSSMFIQITVFKLLKIFRASGKRDSSL